MDIGQLTLDYNLLTHRIDVQDLFWAVQRETLAICGAVASNRLYFVPTYCYILVVQYCCYNFVVVVFVAAFVVVESIVDLAALLLGNFAASAAVEIDLNVTVAVGALVVDTLAVYRLLNLRLQFDIDS